MAKTLPEFLASIIASALLVLVSIVYFGITLWIVKTATSWVFGQPLSPDWAVLAAAILSAASMLAGRK